MGDSYPHPGYAAFLFTPSTENGYISICNSPAPLRNKYYQSLAQSDAFVREVYRDCGEAADYHILLSPGTPATAAAMLLLARVIRARLWTTWAPKEPDNTGVESVDWPVITTYDTVYDRSGSRWSPPHVEILPEHITHFEAIQGQSQAIRNAIWMADRVASTDRPVLLCGETGTGKELFAAAIHRASSRSSKPFMAINCSAMPEQLLESELFGHVKGAFTTANKAYLGLLRAAAGGTVFLDEIGDMPFALQAKMLRALEDDSVRPVGSATSEPINVRFIAATHRDIPALVRDQRFRDDLRRRICVCTVSLPPLRERDDDVVLLAEHILQTEFPGDSRTLDTSAKVALRRHRWPGNYRELLAVMVRIVLFAPDRTIRAPHIAWALEQDASFDADRPVETMSAAEFITHLTENMDELIRRFNRGQPYNLPVPAHVQDDLSGRVEGPLLDRYIRPLLHGRALELATQNYTLAGELLGRGRLDRTRGDLEGYSVIEPYISTLQPIREAMHERAR